MPLCGRLSMPLRGGLSMPLRGGLSMPLRGGLSMPLRGGLSVPLARGPVAAGAVGNPDRDVPDTTINLSVGIAATQPRL